MCCRCIRTVEKSVVRAVFKCEIVFRIAQLIINLQFRIRRQTDDIVEGRNRHLIVVLCRRERLLCICKIDLGGKHIGARDRADAQLRVDVREMRRHCRHSVLTHLHEIARLQDVEIIRRRRQANRLFRLLECKICRVQSVTCRFPLCIQCRNPR